MRAAHHYHKVKLPSGRVVLTSKEFEELPEVGQDIQESLGGSLGKITQPKGTVENIGSMGGAAAGAAFGLPPQVGGTAGTIITKGIKALTHLGGISKSRKREKAYQIAFGKASHDEAVKIIQSATPEEIAILLKDTAGKDTIAKAKKIIAEVKKSSVSGSSVGQSASSSVGSSVGSSVDSVTLPSSLVPVSKEDIKALLQSVPPPVISQIRQAIKDEKGATAIQQALIASISKANNAPLNTIFRNLQKSALQAQASSEHKVRNKVNKVIRTNTKKQDQILARLNKLEALLQAKTASDRAVKAAFGVPLYHI
jgi:hypothetical protein